jgi:hypothetical protein
VASMGESMVENEQAGEVLSALKEMTQTRGWSLFVDHLKAEWGPQGYGRRMQEALSSVPAGPDRVYEIARIAEQVDATARAVNALVEWPKDEMKRQTPDKSDTRLFGGLRRTAR